MLKNSSPQNSFCWYGPSIQRAQRSSSERLHVLEDRKPPTSAASQAGVRPCRNRPRRTARESASRSPSRAWLAGGPCRRSGRAAPATDRSARCPAAPWAASNHPPPRRRRDRITIKRPDQFARKEINSGRSLAKRNNERSLGGGQKSGDPDCSRTNWASRRDLSARSTSRFRNATTTHRTTPNDTEAEPPRPPADTATRSRPKVGMKSRNGECSSGALALGRRRSPAPAEALLSELGYTQERYWISIFDLACSPDMPPSVRTAKTSAISFDATAS